ncbi:RagB/SusD family nutrient uptake outer membrane protein [Mucilaginibacter sp.]|uniref:RagB/SusD family nutrient uptake outer membrane protein n=1 Tax=Mucilaginibacter sp. TaxID=1882438 RepID=UPI0026198DE6|nr:RagB/SusD family nutrient uptake outer membrane protein [Mucilaginibacter sp.]MDB4926402.1 Starch-binding associating with outer rane [Mucilaginibacter sp.]
MKKIIYLFTVVFILTSCNKLNITPASIVQDPDAFGSAAAVGAYFSGLYANLPMEDFRYSASKFNNWNIIQSTTFDTGELFNREFGSENLGDFGYWSDGYTEIRNAEYFLENLSKYASNYTPAQVNNWLGEARFIRAYTYFALVKRYGGVPLVKSVQNYPAQTLDAISTPRNSEQEVYDFIADDLDQAYNLMGATSEQRGRANKYVAAGLKAKVMLTAADVAKYNTVTNIDPTTNKMVQGIPASQVIPYLKASYTASLLVAAGPYKLYRSSPDKTVNFYNLFFDGTGANTEQMLSRDYVLTNYPTSFDLLAIPDQMKSSDGYSSYFNPTLDFVELFDGLPRNTDGTLAVINPATQKYIYYNDRLSFFQNAEPRLLATVLVPGTVFKSQVIDVRRGIFVGNITNGIDPFPGSTVPYAQKSATAAYGGNANMVPSTSNPPAAPTLVTLPDGSKLSAGGLSGVFGTGGAGTLSGFYQRKFLDEKKTQGDVKGFNSFQPWTDMRYGEIILLRAEAAIELSNLGVTDVNYLQDAFTQINDVRDRGGAVLLASAADLSGANGIAIIRKEEKKELAYENKTFWNLRRWRIADTEVNNRQLFILNPILVAANGKYIFDKRIDETGKTFTFKPAWYYEKIPQSEINKNLKLVPNIPTY